MPSTRECSRTKPIPPNANITDSPLPTRSTSIRPLTSRHEVQAGDLHSTAAYSEVHRQHARGFSILSTPRLPRASSLTKEDTWNGTAARISGEDFDLRDEVMSCIAKSIGLLQPPLSGTDSVEASPAFSATDGSRAQSGTFSSSFGSLSLLDLRDDSSSLTGGSSSITNGGYMSGLDNEVEVLFFAAGSTLAKAGERNTGNNLLHGMPTAR
jgi:lysophospholipid hydrolase